jgi:ankyrin repeat protein
LAGAAAAGRAGEVEALLRRGVPVDAEDAEGNTALMSSIRADRPAVAALLRRHGANLDHRNHAGESARDLARAKGDAKLLRALGIDR